MGIEDCVKSSSAKMMMVTGAAYILMALGTAGCIDGSETRQQAASRVEDAPRIE